MLSLIQRYKANDVMKPLLSFFTTNIDDDISNFNLNFIIIFSYKHVFILHIFIFILFIFFLFL